jgi:hypothetical protein
MKMLEKLTNRVAKTASSAVKEEVQSAAIDVLPTLLGIGGMIFGALLFKRHSDSVAGAPKIPGLPSCSTITITTNNYYFGDNFMKDEEEAK